MNCLESIYSRKIARRGIANDDRRASLGRALRVRSERSNQERDNSQH